MRLFKFLFSFFATIFFILSVAGFAFFVLSSFNSALSSLFGVPQFLPVTDGSILSAFGIASGGWYLFGLSMHCLEWVS
ncbi:exported hypothetical protein [Leptospira interrogans serovar Manilae]|uniref:Uncharacterized protein n=1 Tax=Leptospira interrogans serovar Manilae TaxID=214675 RepID=A0AAQ1SQ72_LEPIR|nr:hypothetical protein [Leptospira interrogans]AKP25934.1 hypothetical protein LIMLP_08255 [Leptospira interrogans serovar Manilae]AKP29719.1 hypothetical protein LIMHP_08250 [Leptospira interrogans serovar Manilae]EYU62480.1 hypothetical protein CI00_20055 [Leptospira interrogans serovar Manilae]SOR63402.1 exported hypothetical protein [Leptospira interrogans serovar Manilae]